MASQPLVVERTYQAPADRIWKALTNEDEMREWYFNVSGFKPEVGYEFEFTGGTETEQWRHLCKVIAVDPGKMLKHTWRYDGYPGSSTVTWEIFDEGDKTRVRLTHEGLDTFPADKAEFNINNFKQGWNDILENMLRKYVQG
ncbi:MAG: SRPBCC domain-containing protein [Chitinophagaceae bacterium]|nr:SRPBCC domain-containing protein [Chitinophagaceae bacterium]